MCGKKNSYHAVTTLRPKDISKAGEISLIYMKIQKRHR